jgi:hypothetical protein
MGEQWAGEVRDRVRSDIEKRMSLVKTFWQDRSMYAANAELKVMFHKQFKR